MVNVLLSGTITPSMVRARRGRPRQGAPLVAATRVAGTLGPDWGFVGQFLDEDPASLY